MENLKVQVDEISNDIAKEALTYLAYSDNEIIDKLPDYLLKGLNDKAADSDKDFYVSKDKQLFEQEMSEECKNLLSVICYTYMADDANKEEIRNYWLNNEE